MILRHLICAALAFIVLSSLAAKPIATILNQATEFVGTPYIRGGMSPNGFDCSGFVSYLYKAAVPGLPRISQQMATVGEQVPKNQWQPGDLLFYATGVDPNHINHVAIWYGDGYLIHSISNGPETGVVVTSASSRYWKQRYITTRRVLPPAAAGISPATASQSSVQKPSVSSESSVAEPSPWDSYEGLLTGDSYQGWKQDEDEAFQTFKKKNP